MRAYFEEEQARQHYQRILSVKTTIRNKEKKRRTFYLKTERADPVKEFDKYNQNIMLVDKLKEIYEGGTILNGITTRTFWSGEKKSQKGSLVSGFKKKEEKEAIEKDNILLYNKIMSTRRTIDDLKLREKKLKSYSRLSTRMNQSVYLNRRHSNDIFEEFQNKLIKTNESKLKDKSKTKKQKRRTLTAHEILKTSNSFAQ